MSNNASISLQNSIFDNTENFTSTGTVQVVSNGGNISSDNTLGAYLTAGGSYPDYNSTAPVLDADFVPTDLSPCVDAGNPANISTTTDVAGNDRVQGSGIDIGAFESPFTVDVYDLEQQYGIKIYPNPFVETIHISNTEAINSVRLLDINGREVQQFSVQNSLNISKQLPAGAYLLELGLSGKKISIQLQKI